MSIEKIANDIYTNVLSQRRKGNMKAGVPEGASRELSDKIHRFFVKQKGNNVKWKDLKEEVYGEDDSNL